MNIEQCIMSIIIDNDDCTLFIPIEELQKSFNCNIGVYIKENNIVLFLYSKIGIDSMRLT